MTKGGEGFDDNKLQLAENVAEEDGPGDIIDGAWKCGLTENDEEELWKCWLTDVKVEVGIELVVGVEWVTSLLA